MKHSRLFVLACLVAVGLSPAIAQQPTRLLFEITKDGSLVAIPELWLQSGIEGRIDLVVDDDWRGNPLLKGMRETIRVTPTVRGDDIAVAFNISTGGKSNELATRRCEVPIDPVDACKYFQPSLVISKAVKGGIEWTSPTAGQIRLTVSWAE